MLSGLVSCDKKPTMRATQPTRRAMLSLLLAAPWATAFLIAYRKMDPDSCQDVHLLGDAEQIGRAFQQYTDHAPSTDKQCSKCDFWKPPSDPTQCGSCRIVSGPIHPKGYCTFFARKA
jgi:hypothetical protein